MRKKFFALTALLLLVIMSMGGCADFAFNPIGRWTFVEQRLYTDGTLTDTLPPEQGHTVSLVFKKSGNGYIDSGTKDTMSFTYEYTDKDVTVTRTQKQDITKPSVYQVTDNGQKLIYVVDEAELTDEQGNSVHYRVENVFTR